MKSNLVQGNEYYPFGMQASNSWTREAVTGNNYLANGGTEINQTTQLYDLMFRNYDPALGRMFQVDPMAAKYASLTPYNYSFNNPAGFSDPSGADPDPEFDRIRNSQNYFHNGGGAYGYPGLTYDDWDPMTKLATGEAQCARCWDKDNMMGWFGGGGNMGHDWKAGDGRLVWSQSEAAAREHIRDTKALERGEISERFYSSRHTISWWLVYADDQKDGGRSTYLYFNTSFRSDFGAQWFGAYRHNPDRNLSGVEYAKSYHGNSALVDSYSKLANFVSNNFSPEANGFSNWRLSIGELGPNDLGLTIPNGKKIETTITPTSMIVQAEMYVVLAHELFHVGDYSSGRFNHIYNDLSNNRFLSKAKQTNAVMEIRAYNFSLPIAESLGLKDFVRDGKARLMQYKLEAPVGYEKHLD